MNSVKNSVKKIASVAMAGAIMGITLLSGSGCGFVKAWIEAKIPAPERIEIDGVTYVTGFYRKNTATKGAKRENAATPDYTEGLYEFWKIANTEFEIYGANHKEALNWIPTIYCKESDVEAVKAYYENPENCTYHFQYNFLDFVEISEPVNTAYLETAIEYAYNITEDEFYDPFKEQGFTEVKNILKDTEYYRVNVVKYSADGIFCSPARSGYNYVDGKLYANKRIRKSLGEAIDQAMNEKEVEQTYYLLEGEEYDYIVELFEKYVLENMQK